MIDGRLLWIPLTFLLVAIALGVAMILTPPRPTDLEPTDAPSGEHAEPCDLEHERACNELVDVQGGQR